MSSEAELRQALSELGLPKNIAFVDVHRMAIDALRKAYKERGPEKMRDSADRVITLVGQMVAEEQAAPDG